VCLIWRRRNCPLALRCLIACVVGSGFPGLAAAQGATHLPPALGEPPPPPVLTLEGAIVWGLQNNPEMAALRQQHGVAAAAVVIARTYPHNPSLDLRVAYANGPESAGVTNPVDSQFALLFPVELRGQPAHRRDAALAALSRTDWEIAFHESTLAVHIARAFWAVLYRKEKLGLLQETVALNEKVTEQVRKLVDQNKLRPPDLILARTEVDDARAVLAAARTTSAVAVADLLRALGVVGAGVEVQGKLEVPVCPLDLALLTEAALERRPDLRAWQAAVAEVQARLRLQVADRFGNPSLGPAYQYDQSKTTFIGLQGSIPVPLYNRHRGEIQQQQADLVRVTLELHKVEVKVQQDVQAALARLASAAAAVTAYEKEILPNLRAGLASMEKLFLQGDPGTDVLRVIDLRRKLLRARDGYLDALWEVSQAVADLAAAVGDPGLAVTPCPPPVPHTPVARLGWQVVN